MIDVHDDLAAALADRYELERELGHGGMAIVYLARDVKHGRRVAVKVLRPDLGSSVGAERFLREISVAAKLTHPNILSLHDSGSAPGGLLYYVMPYVEGETLRDRLDREHQLPIAEALAITRQVGDALDYAHAHGVVHRDVKPENILLMGEHVLVADFGLARALFTAGSTRLTESAVTVGTPAYMSPEQAAADPDVDGRADIYSLACVLYEMVAGVAPFRGATAHAVLAQHLTATPPSLCAQRPHCPKAMDAAVQRAMEKVPADRFRTAREFVEAMEARDAEPTIAAAPPRGTPRRAHLARVVGIPIGAAVVVGVAAIAYARTRGAPAPLDPNTFLVAPFVTRDGSADTSVVTDRVADALGEWRGIRLVDATDEPTMSAERPLRGASLFDAARRRRAGRVLSGEVAPNGDSTEARLTLYDAGSGQLVGQGHVTYPSGRTPTRAELRAAVNGLLRESAELPWRSAGDETRPSLTSWLAYDRGRRALAVWDVAAALQQMRAAVREDPANAQGQLWLALTQLWALEPPSAWRGAAKRAVDLSARLAPRDSLMAVGLLALGDGRYPDACAAFRDVVPLDSTGVVGWFGLGECRRWDPAVIPDPRSATGYSFRSSFEDAARAYMHIVSDRPPPQPAFVYSRLADILYTSGNQLRRGFRIDNPELRFFAYPSLSADTLSFVPRPWSELAARVPDRAVVQKSQAMDRDRALLRRLASTLGASEPTTLEGHVALARLLELSEQLAPDPRGEVAAVREIRLARALTTDSDQALALTQVHARLLVKSASWSEAAALLDSLFAAPRSGDDTSETYLGAAALTGRIRAIAEIFRAHGGSENYQLASPDGRPLELPPPVVQNAADAFAFAISGACVEELREFPARLAAQLESYVPDTTRRVRLKTALLRWPLSHAVPCLGAKPLLAVDAGGDGVVLMEQALARGDTAGVRAEYRRALGVRTHDRPGDVTVDYTYLESWLLAAIGDTTEAIAHLDRSLEALPTLDRRLLRLPSQSAALVRAMGLRAELAAAGGDEPTARKWAAAVATLWAHADPELMPYVKRMRALAGS